MPAKSKAQQRLFGMVDAYKKGEMKHASKKIKDIADGMSSKEVKKFAKTKTKGLPEKIEESKINKIIRESIMSIINESQTGSSPINKWNYWCANFENDFIQKVWADDPNLASHLAKKFSYYYDQVGSYGVMLKFYLNLSSENQRMLEDYVLNS